MRAPPTSPAMPSLQKETKKEAGGISGEAVSWLLGQYHLKEVESEEQSIIAPSTGRKFGASGNITSSAEEGRTEGHNA